MRGTQLHSVHPPFLLGGKGVGPLTKFSKREALTGPQFLEGVTFFRGLHFLHENKLKTEIFNDKKFINKTAFSVITKTLNWEILLRFSCFKRRDGFKDKIF